MSHDRAAGISELLEDSTQDTELTPLMRSHDSISEVTPNHSSTTE